jgi:hypothetical protein
MGWGAVWRALVFGVLALAAAISVEVLFLILLDQIDFRLIPQGFGWIFVLGAAFVMGWRFGWSSEPGVFRRVTALSLEPITGSKNPFRLSVFRIWLVVALMWIAIVTIYFVVFDPFHRYYWGEREWIKFLTIILLPPIFGSASIRMFGWALRGARENDGAHRN